MSEPIELVELETGKPVTMYAPRTAAELVANGTHVYKADYKKPRPTRKRKASK